METNEPYVLALVGYNRLQTAAAREFIKVNNDGYDRNGSATLALPDGTLIYPVLESSWIDGIRPDQIILADDSRWEVEDKRRFEIALLKERLSGRVPEEIAVIYYCMD